MTLLFAVGCVHAPESRLEPSSPLAPVTVPDVDFDSALKHPPVEGNQIAIHTIESRFSMVGGHGLDVPPGATSHPEPNEVAQAGLHCFRPDPQLRCHNVPLELHNVAPLIGSEAAGYMAPYLDRVPLYGEGSDTADSPSLDPSRLPPAWWEQEVLRATRRDSTEIHLDIETLLVRTLDHSKFLQGLADLPLIRERSTMEEIAQFDATTFVESRFTRPSDPVGNQLTVGPGGSNRFRENDFASSVGIARKTSRGARVELAQEVGLLTNNSTFIDPRHQGNARLTLNITQPLLSGSGKSYNTSLIMLAKMDERIAWDEVSAQLQDYLVEVTEAYWQLYLERARLKQKERHLARGELILAELEQRREVDAVDSQIARARSAVQNRRSELIRAETMVRNVESKLRGLVNDPALYGPTIEVVPAEVPNGDPMHVSLGDAMSQALQSRSEIDNAIQKVRAAGVRLSVAKNELLPILDVVLETYLSGLRGSNDIGQAWVDQFSVGEPSYSAGLRYEIPLNNRLAKNRHDRRRVEMRQAISQFEFRVEELSSEVEIAVREVDTSYQEMLSRQEAMTASEIDLNYFHKRWELLPGDSRSASFLLEDILEAQDRVAAQESNFAQTQVSYAMSIVRLKRALGILLQSERIETGRTCNEGLDRYIFNKSVETDIPAPGTPSLVDEHLRVDPIRSFDASTTTDAPPRHELHIEPFPMPDADVPLSGNGQTIDFPSFQPVSIESALIESEPIDSAPAQSAPAAASTDEGPRDFGPIAAPVTLKSFP